MNIDDAHLGLLAEEVFDEAPFSSFRSVFSVFRDSKKMSSLSTYSRHKEQVKNKFRLEADKSVIVRNSGVDIKQNSQ